MQKTYETVNSVESLSAAVKRIRGAQQVFASFSQEQVDRIFRAAAMAADRSYLSLPTL